jgi:hypothetical protein
MVVVLYGDQIRFPDRQATQCNRRVWAPLAGVAGCSRSPMAYQSSRLLPGTTMDAHQRATNRYALKTKKRIVLATYCVIFEYSVNCAKSVDQKINVGTPFVKKWYRILLNIKHIENIWQFYSLCNIQFTGWQIMSLHYCCMLVNRNYYKIWLQNHKCWLITIY